MRIATIRNLLAIMLLFPLGLTAQTTFVKDYHQGDGSSYLYSVIQTTDGGYAALGGYNDQGDPYFWLIRTDEAGNMEWSKSYWVDQTWPGIYHMGDRSLHQTPDGGYLFCLNRDHQAKLFHVSASGDSIWEKPLFAGKAFSVNQTLDGGYIVTGQDTTNMEVMAAKTDGNGDLLWAQEYILSNPALVENGWLAWGAREASDGTFMLAGENITGYMYSIPFLMKISTLGEKLWYQNCSFTSSYEGAIYSIDNADADQYYLGMSTTGTYSPLIRCDDNGDEIWINHFHENGNLGFYSVKALGNSNMVGCGYVHIYSADSTKLLLLNLSSDGEEIWRRQINHGLSLVGTAVIQTSDQGFMMSGYSRDTTFENFHGVLIKTDESGHIAGIKDPVEQVTMAIYPNPASENILINSEITGTIFNGSIQIIHPSGTIVFQHNYSNCHWPLKLDISFIDPGFYLVIWKQDGSPTKIAKLIIRR
jgi:hypothetical protein